MSLLDELKEKGGSNFSSGLIQGVTIPIAIPYKGMICRAGIILSPDALKSADSLFEAIEEIEQTIAKIDTRKKDFGGYDNRRFDDDRSRNYNQGYNNRSNWKRGY